MVTSDGTKKSRKILFFVIFLTVMIVGLWFSTKTAQFVTQTFSGSVLNSSAITLWSLYSPTDPPKNSEAGITIQSTNYPPKKTVSSYDATAAASDVTLFDLDVEITGIGILKDGGNTFVLRETLKDSERGAVKFIVTNKGETGSSEWQFRAALPTKPSYVFESKIQKPLAAKKKRTFTVTFDKLSKDKNNLVIEIFILDSRQEITKTNNINYRAEASIVIE